MASLLRITDGTLEGTVNLLAMPGWLLKSWKPAVPDPKGGGTFRNSPMTDGRKLIYRRLDNITDTFNLVGSGTNQDDLIDTIQKLQRLLEKALAYWTSQWQNEPVWIEARAPKETSTRYATIVDYRLNGFGGPFEQPFFSSDCSSVSEALLTIEHMIWQETKPGENGRCVELHNETEYPAVYDYDSKTYYPKNTECDGTYSPDEKNVDLDNVDLYIGHADSLPYKGECQAGIVFETVDIPAGATLLKASLRLIEEPAVGYDSVILKIDGQSLRGGVINSVTVTNMGHSYIWPDVQVYSAPGTNGAGAHIDAVNDGMGHIIELAIIDGGHDYVTPTIVITDLARRGYGATATCTATPIGIDVDQFDGTNADFVERPRTSANVQLSVEHDVTLPISIDITSVVKEIISEANWVSGDHMGIFLSLISGIGIGIGASSAYRAVRSWDYDAGSIPEVNQPKLTLEWTTSTQPLGRETTCAAEVYIANKHNNAPINYIYCYDSDTDVYSENMVGWDYANNMPLFQNHAGAAITPAMGDILYFGSCPLNTDDTNYGPFASLVFDLYSIGIGITGIWEYTYDGAGTWEHFGIGTFETNPLCGDQSNFQSLGVGSIVCKQPTHWLTDTVTDGEDNKEGYWIRFRVTGVSTPTTPYQQHRNIYTAILPYIDIEAERVPGDLPALARIIFESAACPDRAMNALVLGLRSLSRGEDFTAYLNASDVQNPPGIIFTRETNSYAHHLDNDSEAPTGRSLDLTGLNPTEDTFIPVCSWRLDSDLAIQYLGIYHAYVRNYCSIIGAQFRLKAVFGEEYNAFYSDIGTSTLDGFFCAIDLGQLSIQPSSYAKPGGTINTLTIYLEAYASSNTYYALSTIFDIIIIPADEWSGNFGMHKADGSAVLQYGQGLDIDGITTPRNYRAVQTDTSISNSFTADWSRIASGVPIFQQNADQRLWFLQYMHAYGLVSNFENCGAVRAERSARYLLARGSG